MIIYPTDFRGSLKRGPFVSAYFVLPCKNYVDRCVLCVVFAMFFGREKRKECLEVNRHNASDCIVGVKSVPRRLHDQQWNIFV
jgi:hypothetical protein